MIVSFIVSFVNQKGGCSKSTTSVHFAYWLRQQGNSVLIIDADSQGSSSTWAKSLQEPIETLSIKDADALMEQVPELSDQKRWDYIVLDAPGSMAEASRAILLQSHIAIVPCQPTAVDLQALVETTRVIKQVKHIRKDLKTATFCSRAVSGTRLLAEAREALGQTDLTLLQSVIYQRQVVADAFGQEATVWDLSGKPAKDAAAEYSALFSEVLGVAHG
jgi:chromosome partitioning protein